MYGIYILLSLKDKRTYVGYSQNITERFKQHESGRVKATKSRRPLRIIFTEEFKTIQEAKKRELWWKSGAGRRKLKEMFESDFKSE